MLVLRVLVVFISLLIVGMISSLLGPVLLLGRWMRRFLVGVSGNSRGGGGLFLHLVLFSSTCGVGAMCLVVVRGLVGVPLRV